MPGLEYQRDVTRLALEALASGGFALAGSGAIREHGIIDRPTIDIDLFTSVTSTDAFALATQRLAAAMRASGLEVAERRNAPQFANFSVTSPTGQTVEVDLGVDWRAAEPVTLSVGPVLSLEDAVGSKVVAVYSRAEVRDYLDLDAIRQSGKFTDNQLLDLAVDRDPGFDVAMFAGQLEQINRITSTRRVEEYGVGEQELAQLKARLSGWADELRTNPPTLGRDPIQKDQEQSVAMDPGMEQVMKLVHASYPVSARDALRPPAEGPAAETGQPEKRQGRHPGRNL
ncbi:nucleotidyl transferase AbiEii/AbiGii toxin family protein [Paenarthrobacter sp. NPDC090517]|uniref:nucleotidyl transferase AbiEii/AbiGii toxin family protein n=1 Tax=Paenarthrobacter sp. NPDC090517 TaxID=3364381 RepID=UPI0038137C8C